MKKRFGPWAMLAVLSACIVFFVSLGNLIVSYFNDMSSGDDLRLVMVCAWVALSLSFIGLLLSVLSFLHKGEKKGLPIVSCILSILILLLSGTLTFFYNYMFGTLNQDEEFPQNNLYVVQPDEDGTIVQNPTPPETTLPPEEVKRKIQLLELECLVNEDIPAKALAYMDRYNPVCYSVLLPEAEEIQNYLLFGLDAVNSSDSVLLVSMDSLHKKVKIFSLPRDSYVYFPEFGFYTKLNYAYNFGGPAMAVGTINYNLSLNVTDYASFQFDDVKNIINYVGGVTVNMGYAEWNYMTQCKLEGLNVGPCHLDGDTAEFYMRLRETDSELRRMERQREVLHALYKAILALPAEKYPELVRNGMEMCTTSLDSYSLLGLLLKAAQGHYTLEQYGLLDLVDYWGGCFSEKELFYVVYDLDYASDKLYRLIYEDYYVSGYSRNP